MGILDGFVFRAWYEFEGGGVPRELPGPVPPTLTAINTPTYVPAVSDRGARLKLVTDRLDSPYFEIATGTALHFDPYKQSFIVAIKVRLDDDGRTMHIVSRKRSTGSGWVVSYREDFNAISFGLEDDNNTGSAVNNGAVNFMFATATPFGADGRYHSVVCQVDRPTLTRQVWLDGVLGAEAALTIPGNVLSDRELWVGAGQTGTLENLDGRVDQFLFLRGRTWTPAEIRAYHAGVPGQAPRAFWPFPIPRVARHYAASYTPTVVYEAD